MEERENKVPVIFDRVTVKQGKFIFIDPTKTAAIEALDVSGLAV